MGLIIRNECNFECFGTNDQRFISTHVKYIGSFRNIIYYTRHWPCSLITSCYICYILNKCPDLRNMVTSCRYMSKTVEDTLIYPQAAIVSHVFYLNGNNKIFSSVKPCVVLCHLWVSTRDVGTYSICKNASTKRPC